MPRIGVIRGATIMAPITVAVESLITPAERNHRRQRQQEPVAAQPAVAFGAFEEQLVAHPFDVDFSQAAHLMPFLLPLPAITAQNRLAALSSRIGCLAGPA